MSKNAAATAVSIPTSIDKRVVTVIVGVFLAFIGGAVYFPFINIPFLADDYIHLVSLMDPATVSSGQRVLSLTAIQFRPLGFTFEKVLYDQFGYRPAVIHIFNFALHSLVTLQVFWIALLLSKKMQVSILTTVLFICYPRSISAVAWIAAAENEVLMTTFVLGSILTWVYYRKTNRKILAYCTALLWALALLSKESAGPLIGMLVVIDLFLAQKLSVYQLKTNVGRQAIVTKIWRTLKEMWPIFTIFVLYAAFQFYHMGIVKHAEGATDFGLVSLSRLAQYLVEYPVLAVLPFLSHNWILPTKHLVFFVPLALFVYSWFFSKKQVRSLALIWFVLFCLPTMFLSGFSVSDLYFYLPIIGLALAISDFICGIDTVNLRKSLIAAVCAALILTHISIDVKWYYAIRQFNIDKSLIIDATYKHPNAEIIVTSLKQADEQIPLFMNAMPWIVKFENPGFKGEITYSYDDATSEPVHILFVEK